ncbi:hypothetical protein Tco_1102632 [Tanacetum coccineum]
MLLTRPMIHLLLVFITPRYEAIIPSTGATVFAFDMCYCQGFGVMSSMRKPKRVKDYEYHKEKMMLKEARGVALNAARDEWLHDTDEEPDEQELEAHYMYMAKFQDVLTADSGPNYDAEPLEKVQSDDEYYVFATDRQHSE